jgi:thymidylate synthase ThyX
MRPRLPRPTLVDPYKVEIVLDSVSPVGCRLTTFALTYPRFVHAELMTHRVFSRNSASSRAIPSERMRTLVKEHPALPVWWGKNQAGMQAREELELEWTGPMTGVRHEAEGYGSLGPRQEVQRLWLEARDAMIGYSDRLAKLGLHKQLCNRLTETWMPITVLVSATSFANWFHLRDHKDAQPELQVIATEMHYQYLESQPQRLRQGEWHLPFIRPDDYELSLELVVKAETMPAGQTFRELSPFEAQLTERLHDPTWRTSFTPEQRAQDVLLKVSVGRCARVSYLQHDGTRDLEKDVELHDRLAATANSEDPGHFSPFEHVAMALDHKKKSGNFVGWHQLRKSYAGESGPEEDA